MRSTLACIVEHECKGDNGSYIVDSFERVLVLGDWTGYRRLACFSALLGLYWI